MNYYNITCRCCCIHIVLEILMDKIKVHRVIDHIKIGNDIDAIAKCFVQLNMLAWAEENLSENELCCNVDIIKSCFEQFPQGCFFMVKNGIIIGTLITMRLNYEKGAKKSWFELTDNGTLRTHLPTGKNALGVDLVAMDNTGSNLIETASMVTLMSEGIESVFVGARIPSYHKHKEMDVEEYVYGVRNNGRPQDPALSFYKTHGFKIIEIVPNFFPDPKSLGYAAMVELKNPLYWITKILPFMKWIILFIGKKLIFAAPKKGETFACFS